MQKLVVPVLITGGLALGGCASVLPMVVGTVVQQGVGAAVGAATRGGGSAIPSEQLQRAAVTACLQQANQHGRASATTIQQVNRSTLRVVGTIAANGAYPQRSFTCGYRTDGQIIDFRLS